MGKKSVNNGVRFDAERYAATADAWGQNSKTSDETFEYVTESGRPVLIKKLGIEDVLEMGLFDKLDFFTKALAETDTKKPGQAPEGEAGSFAVNALKNFGQLKSTIHRILLAGVIARRLDAVFPGLGLTAKAEAIQPIWPSPPEKATTWLVTRGTATDTPSMDRAAAPERARRVRPLRGS